MSILLILGQFNSQESVQSALILPSSHFQNVAMVSTRQDLGLTLLPTK